MADLQPRRSTQNKNARVNVKSKKAEESKGSDAAEKDNDEVAQPAKSRSRPKRRVAWTVTNTTSASSKKRQKLSDVDVTAVTADDESKKSLRPRREKQTSKVADTNNGDTKPAVTIQDSVSVITSVKSEFSAESVKANGSRLLKVKRKNSKSDKSEVKEAEEVRAEVDSECVAKLGKAHVYQSGVDVYDAMLNQAQIANNNNKFFLLQVLEDDGAKPKYSVWLRWGRVGYRGQTNLIDCGADVEKAIRVFCVKFHDKTKNKFENRNNFQKYPGAYDLIQMDYSKKNELAVAESDTKMEKRVEPPASRLEKRVLSVMELICDLKQMEHDIRSMEYDVKKCPLGNISKAQVKAGFEALTAIEQHISRNDFSREFLDALSTYYTRIPHSFGMRVPPQIRTVAQLKNEITLLETLSDIELVVAAFSKDIDERLKQEQTLHPLDIQYQRLRWTLTAVEHGSEIFNLISNYMGTSHGKTHTSYRLSFRNVFELNLTNAAIEEENRKFREEIGNITLLWHGSRMSNWFGILSQGLRIAPPEAPVTGYMFGKGVYFADSSSKSANYTLPEPKKTRFMVLSEVALGEINELLEANSGADRMPTGKHSVAGVGRYYPDPNGDVVVNGVRVPCGKFLERKKLDQKLQLLYNEFIVYDTRQIRERYLVEVNFDFDFSL